MNHNAIAMVELARGIVRESVLKQRPMAAVEVRLWVGLSMAPGREAVCYSAPPWACEFIEEMIPGIQRRFPDALFSCSHPADAKSQTALDIVLAQSPVTVLPAKNSADEWATAAMLELTTARRPGRVLAWVADVSTSGADWCARLRVVMDGHTEMNELISVAFGPDVPTAVRLLLQEVRASHNLPMEIREVAGKILDRGDDGR